MRKVTHRSPFGLLIQDPASRLIAAEAVPKVKALSTVVMATRMFVRECRFAGMMIGTRAVAGQRERGTVRFLGSFRLRAWLARQAEGGCPDQRRKARVKALGSEYLSMTEI